MKHSEQDLFVSSTEQNTLTPRVKEEPESPPFPWLKSFPPARALQSAVRRFIELTLTSAALQKE